MSARKKLIIFVLTGWLISAELIPAINVSAIEEQASPSSTKVEEELNLESLITVLEPKNSAETPATSSADPDLSLEPTTEVMPSPTLGVTPKEKRKRPILEKNNLQAKEKMEIELGDYQLSDLQINLVDKNGKEITVEKNLEEGRLKISPPRQFFPGKYHLIITSGQENEQKTVLEQDFTWGVLAINTNKSIYLPGETAKLAMAVLDEQGKMVCDASLKLKINPPAGGEKSELSTENGQIIINPECQLHDFTLTPDYEALYQVKGLGKYEMTLSAQTPNGDFTITDFFEVKESVKFDVERDTATRIYPPKIYPVTFNITSFEDFEGEIEEVVPKDFQIFPAANNRSYDEIKEQNDEKIIIWKVSLKKNEKISLGYRFKAPDISPQFYLLGPLTFRNLNPSGHEEEIVFQEGRQWQIASDAPPPYKMTTGRYVGSGNYKSVSGLGFAPEAVIIKAATTGGVGAFLKTTTMIDNSSAYLGSATADDTTGLITLDPDGFTVTGTNANIVNTTWTWAAWGGSDCSATGQFCVGRYTGNGTSPRLIDTGFQPDIAIVKNAAVTTAANFQTVGMTANYAQYLMATAQDTTGTLFTSFSGTGFNVGATNNTSAAIYNFIAFKNVSGSINVGSFTGNGTSQSITGAGFAPDLVITKNTTAATAVGAVYNVDASYGDSSSYFTDTANVVGAITALTSDGFNVGSNSTANGSTNTIFWMAFYGTTVISSSGTFKMATGTYVGNGAYQNINGLGFAPDLVIIKGNTTAAGVFRTTQHNGDVTSYLDAATADFALGIQSLNPDGFNIGTSATVNSNGVNYYWTAYGNAWRPATNSGASDFVIGTYYGNGIDSRNITGLPFQPDLVVIKAATAVAGVFRTSQHVGDSSSFFAATADGADRIQAFNSDGFQIGTNANVNTAATFYRYFAFKSGSNFTVNTYSGNGGTQDITSVGFQPDYLWVKATAATRGVEKHTNMAAANCAPFINVAEISTAFSGFIANGFGLTNAAETNTSGTNNYRYVAWKKNMTVTQPSYYMATGRYVGSGNYKQVTGLGFAPEAVIIKAATTGGVGAMLKTTSMIDNSTAYMGSATADDATGLITLDPDGFTVIGTNANIANTTWSWVAWGGSDCSSSGQFCVGDYLGNGTSPRTITTGFQPDIAIVKRSTSAVAATFQTVGMTANYGQYFMATAQDTTGALFGSIQSTGFQAGATNNTSSGIYHFVSFKITSGSVNVGSFAGNGTSQSIGSMGFTPKFVITKNTTAATPVSGVYNGSDSYGDSSFYFTDTANVVGAITSLDSDGFSVGSNSTANGSGNTIFWMTFNDSRAVNSSGTFKMASGTYVGNGAYQNFNGLGFAPDLVIIKGDTAQAGVFRTTQHNGDVTSYLDAATTDFALGIQSLNPDGFNIGTSATVNSNGVNYYWTAYGNAWRPATNSGASDFVIGTYYGNGVDNRNITGLPFQPDLVVIKRSGASAATFRTSQHSGDSSSFFAGTADAANNIQAFNSGGFQVGTAANVNTAATFYRYFAFKTGSNFAVGTYSGNGTSQNITSVGFQADNLWVKHIGTTRGVQRTSDMATNSALPFINVANVNNAVTAILSNGFSVGSAAETNTSGTNNYRYVAWRVPGITVSTSGTQTSTLNIPSTNNYVGAAFTFMANISSIDITSITITETGTVNANSNFSNVKFYYEIAGTCSYDANETQFGTTQSFNASEKASFTGTMTVDTSQVCGYVVFNVESGASNGQTVDIEISASSDITSSTGLIYGSFPAALSGSTTLSSGNQSPNSPSSLTQKKTDDTVIATGGWTNQTSVKFTATASDPDSSDTLSLCVEKDILGTSFSDTEDSCGTGVAYSGSPVTITVTISGITDANEYHWQARVKDAASAYSSWVVYGGNGEGERDFGLDTTAPTGGTIYDGTETGVDKDFNDGSLSQFSANWSGFDANVSGLNYYEYSIGTTQGGTNVKVWTNNGTNTSITASSLTLQTSVVYYFNVRATDNAGSTQSAVSSDGQIVSPSLTFSVAPSTLSFANLNAGNSYTDTKQATLTTSTNAYGGYVIRAFMIDYLRSADSNFTIPNFDGGTYTSPGTWGAGNKGFGYTSSDTTIQGADKFSGGSLYAPFSQTGPGDIIADHTNNVTGNPIANEQFTITSKVKTDTIQQASYYVTTAVYTAMAQY